MRIKSGPPGRKFRDTQWVKVNWRHGFVHSKKGFSLVAKEGRETLGYCAFEVKGGVGELKELLVGEGARGKGIGSLLISRFERACKGKGCGLLVVKVPHIYKESLAFYRRHGYKEAARIRKSWWGFDWLILRKRVYRG